MKNLHVVAHTHWDREWYFTTQDSLVLSDQVFTDAIDVLMRNEKLNFCLDGQTSILEEYLSIRPEMENKVKALIKNGQLTIGPWYTQTDCLYVNGESIIRNLTYGIKQSLAYGKPMEIAYLPDTFGFNSQMPTIIHNCGLNKAIIRRGVDPAITGDVYFKWIGLSNKGIKTAHILDGYGTANKLSENEEYINNKLINYTEKISKFSSSDNILLCSGGDQVLITRDLDSKIDNINKKIEHNILLSSYEKFFNDNDSYFSNEYGGDFRIGKYDRVHRTIGSIRYDIKKANAEIERKILNRTEPLMAIAKKFDIDVSTELLYTAWKLLMEGQAHDGLGGCITDNVASQVLERFNKAEEIIDGIENIIMFKISEKLGLSAQQILLFNTAPYEFSGVRKLKIVTPFKEISFNNTNLEVQILESQYFEGKENLLIETPEKDVYINEDPYYIHNVAIECDLPAMGFKVFEFVQKEKIQDEIGKGIVDAIENEFYKITFNNGINIFDKQNNIERENYIYLDNVGNDGDTYDFSPVKNDKLYKIYFEKASFISGSSISTAIFEVNAKLPKNLDSRQNEKIDGELKIKLIIELEKNSSQMSCKLEVNNNIDSHRLRVNFNTGTSSENHFASVPFGIEKRSMNSIVDIKCPIGYVETTSNVNVIDELVYYNNTYFLSNSLKEYCIEENELKVTLFSTTGEFGKPNLVYRPGRASGDTTKQGHVMVKTPLAQQHGMNYFVFSLELSDHFENSKATKVIRNFNLENISYQLQSVNKFINRLDNKIQSSKNNEVLDIDNFSLLNITNEKVICCSISPSLYDDAILVRIKNISTENIKVTDIGIDNFICVNAIENADESSVLYPNDFATLKIYNTKN